MKTLFIALILTFSNSSFAKGISCSTGKDFFEITKIAPGAEIIFSDDHSSLVQEIVIGSPGRFDLTVYFSVKDETSPFKGNQKIVITNVSLIGDYPAMSFSNSDSSIKGTCKEVY